MKQIYFFFLVLISMQFINAQCSYNGATDFCADMDASTFVVGNPNTLCTTIWWNEHAQINNMTAGSTYLITSCGTPYDSEITIFSDGGGTPVGYSGSGCGDDASFNFTPPTSGNYEFQMSAQNCGSVATNSTITVTLLTTLGIENNEFKDNIHLLNNPINKKVMVQLNSVYNTINITLTNMVGHTILSQKFNNAHKISFEINAPSGIYFLKVLNDKGEATTLKVLKN